MDARGLHIIAEFSGCDPTIIGDKERVRSIMVEAAEVAGAIVCEVAFHTFVPQGVSGVVVIAESHLSVHTWPESRYVAIDIYTCGEHTSPDRACAFLGDAFAAEHREITRIARGHVDSQGHFGHAVLQPEP